MLLWFFYKNLVDLDSFWVLIFFVEKKNGQKTKARKKFNLSVFLSVVEVCDF